MYRTISGGERVSYRAFKILLEKVFGILIQIIPQLQVPYAVVDSAYAVAGYIRTLQQYGLAVIAKLSSDAVLYLPAKSSPVKYGQKIKLVIYR
ncbi:MAG: transposase [Bacteroidia bacterium]|nr:transposase [Bacteroidia bacterium]